MAAHPAKRAARGKRGSTCPPLGDGSRAPSGHGFAVSRERQRLL